MNHACGSNYVYMGQVSLHMSQGSVTDIFCMTCNEKFQKIQCDFVICIHFNSPFQVPHDETILVLSGTFVVVKNELSIDEYLYLI